MKFKLCVICSIFNFLVYSQDTLDIDSLHVNSGNMISGIYSYNNNSPIFNMSYSGDNGITNKSISFNTNTVYMLQYASTVIANEWQQKTNINWNNLFVVHVFNHSLTRHIDTDNSYGIGIGKWWKHGSISYATLIQNTNYSNNVDVLVFRHSVRVKLKYEMKLISINYEYYYQPNIKTFKDAIVYGNIKLNILNHKKINFTITDVINYRSLSSVKLIHNLAIGVNFNFKK